MRPAMRAGLGLLLVLGPAQAVAFMLRYIVWTHDSVVCDVKKAEAGARSEEQRVCLRSSGYVQDCSCARRRVLLACQPHLKLFALHYACSVE